MPKDKNPAPASATGVRRAGRPSHGAEHERLVHVGFKADSRTVAAIKKLTASAQVPGVVSPKSAAIRRALIDAAEKLP